MLLVVNARVRTNDPRRPWADAVVVRDGRLALVGSSAEARKLAGGEARVIDAAGGEVLPGAAAGEEETAVLARGRPATFRLRGAAGPLLVVDGELREG